ncbi:hypothetical protein CRE_13644 [Caenorhabditis remanei]|uniref:Uncharacterized protein n=1 Tax=Caenorhabditis remanei TaxID=31234 RepID=E3N1F7_CAERE|nr:hypothetical protein CRE_13644 [Caenorhabditis remanei]
MPVIPVRYESLKAILPYIEPNARFQISLRMPSISSLESRIPLSIENLMFSNIETKINEVTYRLGVYRDYGRNETPSDVFGRNQWGGSSDDIDQYGAIIYPGVNNVLPGDIDLRIRVLRDVPTEEQEQHLLQELRAFKMLLAERLNQEYIEDDETRNAVVGARFNDSITSGLASSVQQSSEQSDFSIYASIQFTRRSPKGIIIQRVAYNKYLYEATKTLHTKLFGNRGSSISVKNLKFELSNGILRFPAAIVLKVENLDVAFWNSLVFERFKQVIHPSSLPIQQLKISSFLRFFDCRHSIAKKAKSLIINNNPHEDDSWTPILRNLTNRRVYLENENSRNPPNNYMALIENWLERGRPVGTCFHMGIKSEETVKQCLDTLKQRQEVLGSSENIPPIGLPPQPTLIDFYAFFSAREMPVIPVQYESLKAILPYLDPNTRFQISLRIPSISSLDKRIPLKIVNLKFSKTGIEVNGARYRLGVYREIKDNDVSSEIQMSMLPIPHDIDEHGFTISPGINTVLPGDVDLRKKTLRDLQNDSDRRERLLVQELRGLKKILAERWEYTEQDEFPTVPSYPEYRADCEIHWKKSSVRLIRDRINSLQTALEPFKHRRNNTKPPFTNWIQLTVTSQRRGLIQRIPYNKNLFEAMKMLISTMFGKRSSIISVKNVTIDFFDYILRFPLETKLRIQSLDVLSWNASNFQAFSRIIDKSSFPLQQLMMKCDCHLSNFEHVIVKKARILIVNKITARISRSPILRGIPILRILTNRHLHMISQSESPEDYVDFISSCLENGRPVGTSWTAIMKEETVKRVLINLKMRPDVVAVSDKLVSRFVRHFSFYYSSYVELRVNASSSLRVFYKALQPSDFYTKWFLNWRVVESQLE